MANSKTSDRHVLRDISKIAQNIQSLCNVPTSSQLSNHDILTRFPPQLISNATGISSQLEEIGLSSGFAADVSNTYLKACDGLRAKCESSLRKAIAASKASVTIEILRDMIRIWNTIHSQQTNSWAESAFSRARESVAKTQSRKAAKRPSFNHEYTPLLEKYFEYNAYPSAPDRAVLARKSMMTPRQIEVWFQNHRNRAKREGRTLRKLSSDPLPLELSLQSLEKKMPVFIVPEHERKVAVESDASESEASDEEDTETSPKHPLNANAGSDLTIPAPNHAFPTTYPPSCQYVPFPCTFGKPTFSAPAWPRKPATSLQTRPIGEFDDFIADFSAKLVLREAPSMHGGRKNQPPDASALRPWFTATHTFAPPAPHPAFMRPSSSPDLMSKCSNAIAAASAPSSRLHPSSQLASLIPPTQTNTTVGRKVARLPKRTPKDQGMVYYCVGSTTSKVHVSPSSRSSSTSRVSSSDSDSSTRRRSSSSSSSSSSSTVTTPVSSPVLLPEHAQLPVSVAGVDFQDLNGLFGDPLNIVSPDEGLHLNLPDEHPPDIPAFSGKQRFGFGFEVPSPDHARERS